MVGNNRSHLILAPKGFRAIADPVMETGALLASLVGKTCWSAIAGETTDYVFVLDLGEKHRRSLRLANPRLSFLQRTYEGEYSLLVECSWRIDGPNGVVATCFDDNAPGGLMLRALAELTDRWVVDTQVAHAGCDLTVTFNGGYVLRTLSTETAGLSIHRTVHLTSVKEEIQKNPRRNNWQIWTPHGLLSVGPHGKVVQQTRREAEERFHQLMLEVTGDEESEVQRLLRRHTEDEDTE